MAILAALGVVYLLFLFSRHSSIERLTLKWIILGTVALSLPLLVIPPISSSDVYANGYFGRLVTVHGVNPYRVESATLQDPFLQATHASAPYETTYGPLWISTTAVITGITGDRIALTTLVFRLVNLAALLVLCVLLFEFLKKRTAHGHLLALVAWNPLVLFEAVQNGHHDILVATCVVGALLAIVKRVGWLALLLLTVGGLLKYIPFLLVPLAIITLIRMGETKRRSMRDLILGGGAACACAIIAFAPYWVGWETFRQLFALGQYWGVPFFHPLAWLARLGELVGFTTVLARQLAAQFGVAVFLLSTIALMWLAWQRRIAVVSAWALQLTIFFLFGIVYFQPWYLLLVLPIAPLLHDRGRLALLTIGTLLPLVVYVVFASG
jgi:hypothetical protein